METKHWSHEHPLSSWEAEERTTQTEEPYLCSICSYEIKEDTAAYFCESCDDFYVHRACFELPHELPDHPLHHPSHPLVLLAEYPKNMGIFICDECRELSVAFVYLCKECGYTIDTICAAQADNEGERSRGSHSIFKEKEILHFSHDHKLSTFFAREETSPDCSVCALTILGPGYACLDCGFLAHRSCVEIPEEIRHPYHPSHTLVACKDTETNDESCDACDKRLRSLNYCCSDESCSFHLHVRCAQISQGVTPLKHYSHPHDLYYFLSPEMEVGYYYLPIICDVCSERCEDSMYKCFSCPWYCHLDCLPIPRTIKHSGHNHSLTLRDLVPTVEDASSEEQHCHVCKKKRDPRYPVYYCKECPDDASYFAHIECLSAEFPEEPPKKFKQEPPKMVSKSSVVKTHQKHNRPQGVDSISSGFAGLKTQDSEKSICYECRDILQGSSSLCAVCTSKPDSKRALSTDSNIQLETYHFVHDHILSYFNAQGEIVLTCNACRLRISGSGYCCLKCSFFVHQSCMQLPRELNHPYHPVHPLQAGIVESDADAVCRACHNLIQNFSYHCSESCNFHLDVLCAKNTLYVKSSLKHECHEDDIYCFVASDYDLNAVFNRDILDTFKCNVCRKICKDSLYLCLQCKWYCHVECLQLPHTVEHDCHSDPLTLAASFVEDDSGVYYCYACGEKRDPRYPVYHCEQCSIDVPFAAHIECVLPEVSRSSDETNRQVSMHSNVADSGAAVLKAQCKHQTDIKDDHILTLHDDDSKLQPSNCDVCHKLVKAPYYTCGSCSYKFHQVCAEVPLEMKHPLNPLLQLTYYCIDYRISFVCDGCGKIVNKAPRFECKEDRFRLDLECAYLYLQGRNNLKENKTTVKISHFIHHHELALSNSPTKLEYKCKACHLPILGSAYCCTECRFFLHESCVDRLQRETQHQYHHDHVLICQDFDESSRKCGVCKLEIYGIGYSCAKDEFSLHFTCATYLTSTLKHKCHEHVLYCFAIHDLADHGFIQTREPHESEGKNARKSPLQIMSESFFRTYYGEDDQESDKEAGFLCKACDKTCTGSLYRCIECNFNLHHECIPAPQKIKYDNHVDPLNLVDSFYEDDSGEYICDVCINSRNPNHVAYCCDDKECHYVAHIGCLIHEGESEIEVL